jgi:hypothetical protein
MVVTAVANGDLSQKLVRSTPRAKWLLEPKVTINGMVDHAFDAFASDQVTTVLRAKWARKAILGGQAKVPNALPGRGKT